MLGCSRRSHLQRFRIERWQSAGLPLALPTGDYRSQPGSPRGFETPRRRSRRSELCRPARSRRGLRVVAKPAASFWACFWALSSLGAVGNCGCARVARVPLGARRPQASNQLRSLLGSVSGGEGVSRLANYGLPSGGLRLLPLWARRLARESAARRLEGNISVLRVARGRNAVTGREPPGRPRRAGCLPFVRLFTGPSTQQGDAEGCPGGYRFPDTLAVRREVWFPAPSRGAEYDPGCYRQLRSRSRRGKTWRLGLFTSGR